MQKADETQMGQDILRHRSSAVDGKGDQYMLEGYGVFQFLL